MSSRSSDPLTDTTFLTLQPFRLVDATGQPTELTLRAFGSFSGDVPRESVISLGFIAASRTWQYSSDTEKLFLTLDGAPPIKVGPLHHEWTTTMDGAVFQQMWLELSLDVFRAVVRAARVQGLLGKSIFVLNAEQLGALRALAAELSPKS